MKQILQNMKNGKTMVEDVPIPGIKPGHLLIHTSVSLLSSGTERMLVEFAEKSLVGKATSRPDLVKQIISKAKREGLVTTAEAAFNKLDQPLPLGYSSAGTVIEVGAHVTDFHVGDRVACAGGGYAVHAEYAVVPRNLVVKLPDTVDFEAGAFTTLGAIAMQGFRLSGAQLGESMCIIGLGLLGLLAAQIGQAAGCQVCGVDVSESRVDLARQLGISSYTRDSFSDMVEGITTGKGFDSVLICADTQSDDPVELAGKIARELGSVVVIGSVGMNIPRKTYYEKELDFKVSRSYGPGRYDPQYEEGGIDYPYAYVRWSEGRNMASFVELINRGMVKIKPLITHRFPIENAPQAYQMITGKTDVPFLGVLLTYPAPVTGRQMERKVVTTTLSADTQAQIKVGVLGAGNYARAVFLPILKKTGGAELRGIATVSGLNAKLAAKKFGFEYATSSDVDILRDTEINTVVVLTRHQEHARLVLEALQSGKAVYCEKPLALNQTELTEIEKEISKPGCPLLTVGFNRRFAPMATKLSSFFMSRSEPLWAHYRVNAGFLPLTHWLHDTTMGGGRIVGEGCHFIDFLTFLVGASPISVSAFGLDDAGKYHQDNVSLTFSFTDGSIGIVTYLANGNKNFPKERIEVFCGGRVGILNDFRSLELVSEQKRQTFHSLLRQDKGHAAAWRTFLSAVERGNDAPIPYDHLLGTTQASFAAVEALRQGCEIKID